MSDIEKRMSELMIPIDNQILMCDTDEDQLMFACAMLQRSKEILDFQLGEEKRKVMFKEYSQ
jgi:hypothetical protein